MNQNKLDTLKRSLDYISPSDEKKQQMLNNILDRSSDHSCKFPLFKIRPLYPLVASLIILVGTSYYISSTQVNLFDDIPEHTDYSQSAPSHIGMRKFMNYRGNRYVVLENISNSLFDSLTLTNSLGILDTPIELSDYPTDKSDSYTNLSSTFGLGGEVWETDNYSSQYRLVVKHNDILYLCEIVGKADDSEININEFIVSGDFYNRISEINVMSKNDSASPTTLNNNECKLFLDKLSTATFTLASNINYDELFSVESMESSLSIVLIFNDGTTMKTTFYPSLSIFSLGDNYFTIPPDSIN